VLKILEVRDSVGRQVERLEGHQVIEAGYSVDAVVREVELFEQSQVVQSRDLSQPV
jgi:hypothetical protein